LILATWVGAARLLGKAFNILSGITPESESEAPDITKPQEVLV
jgi:hypothetical protein